MDSSGAKASELRYKPYGEVRYSGLPNGTGTDYRFTGQRQLAGLGLYQMGARWVDPSLGRWLSADTLVPEPANPQSLNRYSYVYNRPLVAIDTSGHFAWFVTAALGAVAGAGVSYAGQVYGNIVQNGLTVDAFKNVDGREIAKSAIVGAVVGGTMGLGLAALGAVGTMTGVAGLGTGVLATGTLGGFSGLLAGRVEHLVDASYAEYDRWRAGQPLEFGRLWDDAVASGIINTRDMVIDTGTGILFAWAGKALGTALQKAGVIGLDDVSSTTTSAPTYVIGFRPGSEYITLETARGPIQLAVTQFQVFLSTLQAVGVEAAQEYLVQALEEATTD